MRRHCRPVAVERATKASTTSTISGTGDKYYWQQFWNLLFEELGKEDATGES